MDETAILNSTNSTIITNYFDVLPKLNGGGKILGNFYLDNTTQIIKRDSIFNINTTFDIELYGTILGNIKKEGDGILNIKYGQFQLDNMSWNINNGIINLVGVVISMDINSNFIVNSNSIIKGNGYVDNIIINSGALFNPNINNAYNYLFIKNLILNDNSTIEWTINNNPTNGINGKDNSNICKLIINDSLNINNNSKFKISLDDISVSSIQTSPDFEWQLMTVLTYFIFENNLVEYPDGFNLDKWSVYQQYLNLSNKRAPAISNLILKYNNVPACLTENTKILTPYGYILVNKLKKNDYIITNDLRKVKIIDIYYNEFEPNKKTLPYIIHKNSIAQNYPSIDIKLSGGHLIKYKDSWIVPSKFGIFNQYKTNKKIKYYHVKLENYETDNLILEGGLVVESMGSNVYSQIYKDRFKNAYKLNKISKK